VIPGTLVLLGSPLLAPGSWAGLPNALEAADPAIDVLDVHVPDDETPPYGQRYVTAVARAAAAVQPRPPLVLVAHSGAGPLLPAIGRAMRDAGRQVGGYLFVDAGLPATGVPGRANRLDLMRREDPELAITVEAVLETGGRFPDWTLPGVTTRPRSKDFFTEPLPIGDDWPSAPCGYLQASPPYDGSARQAQARGWPLVTSDADHHLPWLAEPNIVARQLLALIEAL
jgi:hypothetical protein